VYCGGGRNYQCGVLCALRIREATLEKEAYLYLTEVVEWMLIDVDLN